MQKHLVQERFSYLLLHHRYLPPDRVTVWSLNSYSDPHFFAFSARRNRKHIDPFPPNNQSTCFDIGASAFERINTLRNVVKYRSEVVIITFRTSLNMVQDVIKYPAEPY